ncbi:MAG: hypothetical protein ICV81_17700 [Flavisolibacter sp.]|nr:hypothetical protein [Flavisolibacter sp.]
MTNINKQRRDKRDNLPVKDVFIIKIGEQSTEKYYTVVRTEVNYSEEHFTVERLPERYIVSITWPVFSHASDKGKPVYKIIKGHLTDTLFDQKMIKSIEQHLKN